MPKHTIYVEPFAGASHVFLKKPLVEKNVLNDTNKELTNFFKQLKNKQVCCRFHDTRKTFKHLKNKKNKTVCDYIALNKISYGGKGTFGGTPSYGVDKRQRKRTLCYNGSKLGKAKITSKDFTETIREHDSANTLFYVDPPYVKANQKECLYNKGKCQVTPQQVASALENIKGKAIVSYDDHPEVKKAFKNWNKQTISLPYSLYQDPVTKKTKGKKQELLLTNY